MTTPASLGPLAKKLVLQMRAARQQKVVDLSAVRTANAEAAAARDRESAVLGGLGLHPMHAAYMTACNFALTMLEQLQILPALRKHFTKIEKLEDEYMPSGPPMSPLTRSFFWNYVIYDLGVGVPKETLGSCVLAIAREAGANVALLESLEQLCASRMGFFVRGDDASGKDGEAGFFKLIETVTMEEHVSVCCAGYRGSPGELWLARLVPPLHGIPAPWVVLTTPYVIVRAEQTAWADYFKRALGDVTASQAKAAYPKLMKKGPEGAGWCEYVFEAYVNHTPEAIFLHGLPDIAATRPQSPEFNMAVAAPNRAARR